MDFIKLGPAGSPVTGDVNKNEDWPGYGAEVCAVADATVIETRNFIPENMPLGQRLSPAGNCVWLDLGNSRYAYYEHLQPNSVRVAKGDRVKEGQVLGLIGNSGNSDLPHLHFSMHDAPYAMHSTSLPFVIRDLEFLGQRTGLALTDAWEPTPSSQRARYSNQWFVNDCVYRFVFTK